MTTVTTMVHYKVSEGQPGVSELTPTKGESFKSISLGSNASILTDKAGLVAIREAIDAHLTEGDTQ